jgi:hypothetical protein
MILYPDQETSKHYNAKQLKTAKRLDDHAVEPAWGVYIVDGLYAVLADCDVAHAEEL